MRWLLLIAMMHGYSVHHEPPRPDLLGLTDTVKRTVTVYTEGKPPPLARKVLAYELAHVEDVVCMTDAQRDLWDEKRHLSGPWYAPDGANEHGYGAGDFADVVSLWAVGPAYFVGPRMPTHRSVEYLSHLFHFAHPCTRPAPSRSHRR